MATNYGSGFTPANQGYTNPNPVWYPGMVLPGVGELKAGGGISPITSDQSTAAASAQYQGLEGLTNFVNSLDVENQTKALDERLPGVAKADTSAMTNVQARLDYDPSRLGDAMNDYQAFAVGTGSPTGPSGGWGLAGRQFLSNEEARGEQQLAQLKASNPAAPITPAGGLYQTMEQQKLAKQQLAQQLKIAEMNDATQRATASMGGGRGGGGGGGTPSLSPMTPFPNLFPDDGGQQPYVDPNATAFTSSSNQPSGTYYNPITNTSNYDYGLPNWFDNYSTPTTSAPSYYEPSADWNSIPSGTLYNPSSNTNSWDGGLGGWDSSGYNWGDLYGG